MGELGATCAIETQPGHVLTRLLASAAPTIAAISLQDSGLAAAARRANRLLDNEDRPPELDNEDASHGSRGNPNNRSAMMLSCTSEVPP
jgi:hypothetical protein